MKPLTTAQTRALKRDAHHLKPILNIGKDGLTKAWMDSLITAFNQRELLKIKRLDNCELDHAEITEHLNTIPDLHVIQRVGHTYTLYRPFPEDDVSTH